MNMENEIDEINSIIEPFAFAPWDNYTGKKLEKVLRLKGIVAKADAFGVTFNMGGRRLWLEMPGLELHPITSEEGDDEKE